jgi:hypothetical protein
MLRAHVLFGFGCSSRSTGRSYRKSSAAGGKLSLEDFHQIDPAYGSRAYQADGIGEIRAYEDRQAA